ncbi:MAG: phosphatidate cytidylyltransferase [Chthoniobacterales bacterium]
MSPQLAAHNSIFLSYVCVVAATLIGGGLILAIVHFTARKPITSIWQTYRAWLVMAPLAAGVVFAGRVPFIVATALLAILAFREFARVSGLNRDRWISAAVYLGTLIIGAASLFRRSFAAIAIFTITLTVFSPIARNVYRGELQRIALGVIAFVYVGWMFGHLGLLADAPNAYGYVCFVIFATEVSDIAAFTFGHLLGRHPLRSEISPTKTWEGAFGALGIAMILPWLLRFSFPEFGAVELLLAGVIVGIGGQIGDLSISMIKREIGIKNVGTSIPGHGGILDRIDSLIFVAPLFFYMADHYHHVR